MDRQHNELQNWAAQRVSEVFSLPSIDHAQLLASWSDVAGDASARRYYRLAVDSASVIVVDSSADLDAAAEFVRIAGILLQGDIRVPQIYSADLEKGYCLIEDFGDQMLRQQLAPGQGQRLFDTVLPVLCQLASCAATELPDFSAEKLLAELDLFDHWYVQRHLRGSLSAAEQSDWQRLKNLLIGAALAQPQVVVHRDFHSCNLHLLKEDGIGVIDFQDAVRGPLSYDLASWLWDRYIHWPREDIERWIEQSRLPLLRAAGQSSVESGQWLRDCDWMGLQRNLKIVGIFARLHYRDGKQGYLEMIGQFAGYVLEVAAAYDELEFAMPLLNKYLKIS